MRRKYVLSGVPQLRRSRSRFNLSHSVKGTMNVGDLVPLDVLEVLPGDTFKANPRIVLRVTSSFIKPVLDNLFLDVYHFFVPNRLLTNWEQIMGESSTAWAPPASYSVPTCPLQTNNRADTVASAFGLPQGTILGNVPVSVLPFRAFAKIYDDWFRDENLINPMNISTGNARTSNETFNTNDWSVNNYFGLLPKVSKIHDIFTSCLPAPQKGDAVSFPIADIQQNAPVFTGDSRLPDSMFNGPMTWGDFSGLGEIDDQFFPVVSSPSGGYPVVNGTYKFNNTEPVDISGDGVYPNNLYAKVNAEVGSVTVNDLRYAFQMQRVLETFARGGSRYVEMLRSFFGVTSPDARLQRSEFLGGRRIPVSVFQTVQTAPAASESETPIASVSGWSSSFGKSAYIKSFTEHGLVLTVGCIRQIHSYQQGIPRLFTRKGQYDFYLPTLNNIGEQPIMKYELYSKSGNAQIFGYNEAWVHYRSLPNKICGALNSTSKSGLDIWHFGDEYSVEPSLVQSWIEESYSFVDRALSVSGVSPNTPQFMYDMYYDLFATRVMSTYSVPGLIDHH